MINLSACINSLGYGVVGTNVALALEAIGEAPALWPLGAIDADPSTVSTLRAMVERQTEFNPDAPSLRIYHQFDLAQHIGRGMRVAYPFFELDRFHPTELHHLGAQDLLIAPSRWAQRVLEQHVQVPVAVARPGVNRKIFYRPLSQVVETKTTTFLSIGKWEVRKGHDVIVDAFCKAFTKSDNVRLVMHCHNPCFRTREEMNNYNNQWIELYKNCALGDKVVISLERFPSQREVAMLMGQVDVGLFPSRGEGWNLEAAEMLAMGKTVILTNYSSHTEFASATNALLIDIDEVEDAHDGVWFNANAPYWKGNPGKWAKFGDNQIEQLVNHMREAHRRKQNGELMANDLVADSMNDFTWENTAQQIMEATHAN